MMTNDAQPTVLVSNVPDSERIDLSTWDDDSLIRVVGVLCDQRKDINLDIAFYSGELCRRMARKNIKELNHPDFDVERTVKTKYVMSPADCDEYIATALALGFDKAEIAKAVSREETVVYSTKYASINALAKRAGTDLQDIADRIDVIPDGESVKVTPKKTKR
jgi:hypothetical protein